MGSHASLEHQEHAEHAAHSGNKKAALLVAILAALLAISEQRAKHSEIRLEESAIGVADSWAQYQAKSVRSTLSKDLADVVDATQPGGKDTYPPKVSTVMKRLQDDSERYEHGNDGKDSIAKRAHELEEERAKALQETHSYDNASAALELGIVLATASAITASGPLLLLSLLMGVAGIVFDVLAVVAPALGLFRKERKRFLF